jgi:hypothetical protein
MQRIPQARDGEHDSGRRGSRDDVNRWRRRMVFHPSGWEEGKDLCLTRLGKNHQLERMAKLRLQLGIDLVVKDMDFATGIRAPDDPIPHPALKFLGIPAIKNSFPHRKIRLSECRTQLLG